MTQLFVVMQQLHFVSQQPIEKGWSCDRKYCVTTEDGVRYLLRVTPEEAFSAALALLDDASHQR